MARIRRSTRRKTFGVVSNTMSMIDVIFILLAFFLSVTQIKKSTVKVNLPEVSEAVATGDKIEDEEPVRKVIQLSSDGVLFLGDRKMDSAEDLFREFDAETSGEAAGRPVVVEIISDREAGTGVLVDVINYLTKKKVKRLEFLAVERDSIRHD